MGVLVKLPVLVGSLFEWYGYPSMREYENVVP